MMIQQMGDITFNGKTVCDFGTGTGILAILAEKLGHKKFSLLIMITGVLKMQWKISCEMNAAGLR